MAEVNFELYNNQLVQQLVGASDANLRLIEKILNVEISSFGNQINIKGSQDAVDQAKTAIDLLYGKVSKGIEIGEQEVKAAVRMSEEGPEKIDGQNLNDIVLKTKKRHIYPRSATQAKYIQEMMKNELVFGLGPAGTGKTYLAVATWLKSAAPSTAPRPCWREKSTRLSFPVRRSKPAKTSVFFPVT